VKAADYARVKTVLLEVMGQPPAERARVLDRLCGADEALRAEVQSLLAQEGPATGDLQPTLPASLPLADPPAERREEDAPLANRRIGPYRIERELGRGGMGAVYLAVRADDAYHKRVAIKLMGGGVPSEESRARFRSERHILAALTHPNIAALLDGGSTDGGEPYVVMEYVEGRPIDEYCRAGGLSVEARLRLFRDVCAAVQYAHGFLVVHRDIKPGNILVTPEGTPKLLDFGIAKLLDPALVPYTLAQTASSVRVLTPAYASPEQIRGEAVTTATDVYSLGVLLYELLTGERPYTVTSERPGELEEAVLKQEPPRPSSVASRARGGRRRRLPRDLDTIVLKALRKEPAQRYASVDQLSEDVRRHLEGLPIRARPDTWRYRAGKFAGRHRLGVAVATLFVLLLATFAGTMFVQARRIARERDAAQRERARAEQVAAFLVDIFKASDPAEARGETITARELLDRGAERIERELGGEPETRATLEDAIGQVYMSLGLYPEAETLLSRALESQQSLHTEESAEVADALFSLGQLRRVQGDLESAESLFRQALGIRRQVLGENDVAVAEVLSDLGSVLRRTDLDAAEAAHRQALAIRRERLPPDHPDISDSINNLALVLDNMGRYAEAEPLFRELVERDRRDFGEDHPYFATTLNNLGMLLNSMGKYEEAKAMVTRGLEIRREILGPDHPEVATSLNNLGLTAEARGDYAECARWVREAITVHQKRLAPGHPDLATSHSNLGWCLMRAGDLDGAEAALTHAVEVFRGGDGPTPIEITKPLSFLAELEDLRGNGDAAEAAYREVLELCRAELSADHPVTTAVLVKLGTLLTRRGLAAEAEPLLREAVAARRQHRDPEHPTVAIAESALGACLTARGRYEEAEPLLRHALETLRDGPIRSRGALGETAERLVTLYRATGRAEEAASVEALLPGPAD
jgi:tetratricopeptide (TPR) repeat protein/tRNA A-37 threonylcarbamoyl transferase component Bud32